MALINTLSCSVMMGKWLTPSHEVFEYLYSNESDHPREFLLTKKPIVIGLLLQDQQLINIIDSAEPGFKVDYDGLHINLDRIEPHIKKQPSGIALLEFFRGAFEIKTKWLLAAIKYEAFNSYTEMLHQCFNVHQEETESVLLQTNAQDYLTYKKDRATFTHPRVIEQIQHHFDNLQADLITATNHLLKMKTSTEMCRNTNLLWRIVLQCDYHFTRKHQADALDAARKQILKYNNHQNRPAHLVQLGEQRVTRMNEQLTTSLSAWLNEQAKRYKLKKEKGNDHGSDSDDGSPQPANAQLTVN